MKKCEISKASLGRIPVYLNYIESLSQDTKFISSTKIANDLGFGEVQVRKDLSLASKNGKPKIGYEKSELKQSLAKFLQAKHGNAVIVGAGKLGRALLDYNGFNTYGIEILAAFDIAVKEEQILPSGKNIFSLDKINEYCNSHNVKIGIIATPAEVAQSVLNKLYENKIKLIWCFAPCRLYKPVDVIIQYENLALSLAHLNSQSNS